MSGNLYEIGVRMTMHQNVSPILTAMAHQFMHLHHHINNATAASRRFQQAITGAVTAFAGFASAKGLAHVIDEGAKLVNVQQQMVLQGWKQHDLDEAMRAARKQSAIQRSLSVQELLEIQKEVAPALGSREHAVELLGPVAKLATALRAIYGEGANVPNMLQEAVKSAELSGNAMSSERLEQYFDIMARALKAFGGTITPHDYNMYMRGLKTSAPLLSDRFVGLVAPTLMQELGAPNAGNALLQATQQLSGGRMMRMQAEALDSIGLINRQLFNPYEKTYTAEGRLVRRAPPGSVLGADLFATDPDKWVAQYLVPAMVKHGKLSKEQVEAIARGDIKSPVGHQAVVEVARELSSLIGRQTAQGVIDVLLAQQYKVGRDSRLISEAYGLNEGASFLNDENYQTNLAALHEQWGNVVQAFGAPGVPAATEAMKDLSIGLNSLSEAAFRHPNVVKAVLATVAGFVGVLVLVGTVLLGLAVAGVVGAPAIIAAAVAAIIAGIAALAVAKWDDLKRGINALWIVAKQIAADFVAAVLSIPEKVGSAIQSMASAIAGKITNALNSIVGGLRGMLGIQPGNGDGVSSPKAIRPQSWVPPANNGGPRTFRTALVLDGRVLGEAVAQIIARNGQFPGASSDFDGMASPMPVDYSPI